jgi:cyclase
MILLDGFSVLKTINFKQRRNLGSPITVVRTYNTRNVDELIILDIDASKQNRPIDRFTIQDIAQECFMPLTVGGGIRSVDDIRDLLNKGADKVAINTHAIENPSFISNAANIFGSQCIVVSVDVIENGDDTYSVYSKGKVLDGLSFLDWIVKIEKFGAGELLINSVSKDGSMSGASIGLAEKVSGLVSIPVIYAGGISGPENAALVAMTDISAVGISSIFHFTDSTPEDCRLAFKDAGVPVR